jgi:hypothetical protein
MLQTVTSDFQAAGHCVTVLLDSRLAMLNPPIKADYVVQVSSSQEIEASLYNGSKCTEAVFVIAPESNQVLQSIVERVKNSSLLSLNCSANSIAKVANKANLYANAKLLGLHVPETLSLNDFNDIKQVKAAIQQKLRFPVLFKPINGTSCEGLSIVRTSSQIAPAIAKLKRNSKNDCFIVQEFIDGIAASVSLISAGHQALPVSLNKQDVTLCAPDSNSSYNGGQVPLDSDIKEVAFSASRQLVESFGDLRGYVGVDLVLTKDKAFLVDVNPRLTTSYIGMRKVAYFNPAEAIFNVALKNKLPKKIHTSGYSCFSKVILPKPTFSALPEIYKMSNVASPPFPLATADVSCAIIEAHDATLHAAQLKFREAKERLQQICHGGA